MAKQAILIFREEGKDICVKARCTDGATEPEDWKSLAGWSEAGWKIKSMSGNREHGGICLLEKD